MRSSLILLFTGTKRASHRLKTLLFSECPTMEHLLKKSPFPLNKLKKNQHICRGTRQVLWLWQRLLVKIGRASCRERVSRVGGRGASRRRHTRSKRDWSSDVCSSDL